MLKPVSITWGADPEGFFEQNGRIIGSEKVLPEDGLGHVVLDGVQFELHPEAATNIEALGCNVRTAFMDVRRVLRKTPGTDCCFQGVVEVTRQELDSLSEKSRILGCAPSKNIYGLRGRKVNGKTYRKRSAGGHIHLGLRGTNIFDEDRFEDERSRQVPLLDIFVGNTGVLLDRDPAAVERRKVYGMVGEYRTPPHGLEYRTLSNFWLQHSAIMSLMFGMAHVAVSVLEETLSNRDDLEKELEGLVNIKKVIKAVQTNDFSLARANFDDIRPFLEAHLPERNTTFPLRPQTIDKFLHLTDEVEARGLAHVFPTEPLDHWSKQKFIGFNTFLEAYQ